MNSADESMKLPRQRHLPRTATGGARARVPGLTALQRLVTSPRFYVYLTCTMLAVLTNHHLGKEMLWDTLDYHVYAGFSALHDRFGQDYFAAGPQGYFNPYAYVPFYLLLRSKLTPFADASILAVLQSAILWLTFELAVLVAPRDRPRASLAIGIWAAVFAFLNPVLMSELGSSYADITTAEIVLAGWLVLLGAVRTPGAMRVLCAALLLGAASGLKLTNAVHAISAAALLLFIPGGWRSRLRHTAFYASGVAASFIAVCVPWSLRLEQHFGNPFFPLLNGVFRSPDFTTAPIVDYRFIPLSFGAALLRPFTIASWAPMVQYELLAPDLRYALLEVLALLLLLQAWWRLRKRRPAAASAEQAAATRALTALGCGFLLDWVLWLTASGNGRYFIPMACVAAALGVAVIFRLFAARPKLRNGLLAVILGLQCFVLYAKADYREHLPWTDAPWVSLSMPAGLASQPSLYFMVGVQSHSFMIPELPAGSGFINLDGNYVLGPHGANGERIEALIQRYAPHLRVLVPDPHPGVGGEPSPPTLEGMVDVLEPFGLKPAGGCLPIVAHGVTTSTTAQTEHLVTCQVDRVGPIGAVPLPGQQAADLALDHLEDACPALFQPRRVLDSVSRDPTNGYVFTRRYWNTNTIAWVFRGSVILKNVFDIWEENIGSEQAWATAPRGARCGRAGPVIPPPGIPYQLAIIRSPAS